MQLQPFWSVFTVLDGWVDPIEACVCIWTTSYGELTQVGTRQCFWTPLTAPSQAIPGGGAKCSCSHFGVPFRCFMIRCGQLASIMQRLLAFPPGPCPLSASSYVPPIPVNPVEWQCHKSQLSCMFPPCMYIACPSIVHSCANSPCTFFIWPSYFIKPMLCSHVMPLHSLAPKD